jgi:hypothetical protein
MVPWFWFWSPQFHFPLGGSVAQRFDPDFFSTIPDEAGQGDVEREIADGASYGRQLGLISEVLLAVTGQDAVTPAEGEEALQRLKKIYTDAEAVKRRHRGRQLDSAIAAMEKLRKSDPAALALVVQRFSAQARLPRAEPLPKA